MMNAPAREPKVQRHLIFGDPAFQYPVERHSETFVVASLAEESSIQNRAVERLRAEDSATDRIVTMSRYGGTVAGRNLGEPVTTWDGCSMTEDFWNLVREFPQGSESSHNLVFAPLMLMRCHTSDSVWLVDVLMASRFRASGVVFTRSGRFTTEPCDLDKLLPKALAYANEFHEPIGNDKSDFKKFHPGVEIEAKYNLHGPVSPWALASALTSDVDSGILPGFILDVGNELLRRSVRQEVCEVISPPDQAGYIAARTPAGSTLKIKTFSEDGLRRKEIFRSLDSLLEQPLADFLTDRYPHLEIRPMPSIARTLYCVNVESATTGHLYSVEFDEVKELAGGSILRQAEVEYDYSRIHDGLDAEQIEPELWRLTDLIGQFLERNGVHAERTFYSKLSFLRDSLERAEAPQP